jgi:hypothetical protein
MSEGLLIKGDELEKVVPRFLPYAMNSGRRRRPFS